MARTRVDVAALYAALNRGREERGNLSWREVARQAGVGPSTISRLAQGHRPDLDSFAALVHWLGLPAEGFMRHPDLGEEQTAATPAADIATARARWEDFKARIDAPRRTHRRPPATMSHELDDG